jgi:hypothetical protein
MVTGGYAHTNGNANAEAHLNIKNLVRTSKRTPHFTTFFFEGGVGLVPKRVCLLTLGYYAFPS